MKHSMIQRFWLFFMGFSLSILTHTVQASEQKRCFSNAHLAYEYLLKEEKQQSLDTESTSKANPNSYSSNSSKININTASESDLVTLAGIGSKKAQAIVLYRSTMGQFNSVDDLAKVHGIGEKTVDKNRTRLSIKD